MVDKTKETSPYEMKLKCMCRVFDEVSVRTLGGWASSEQADPQLRLEAIKVLLDRGHGRPKGEKKHKHAGADGKGPVVVQLVYPPLMPPPKE